jgi:hypothetical protein
MKIFCDLAARGHDVAHVWVLGFAQRRWHADVHRVQITDYGEIRRSFQLSGFDQRRERRVRNVPDIGIAGIDPRDFGITQIDTRYQKARFGEFDAQRQSHVTQAYNPDFCLACPDLLFQQLCGCWPFRQGFHLTSTMKSRRWAGWSTLLTFLGLLPRGGLPPTGGPPQSCSTIFSSEL